MAEIEVRVPFIIFVCALEGRQQSGYYITWFEFDLKVNIKFYELVISLTIQTVGKAIFSWGKWH